MISRRSFNRSIAAAAAAVALPVASRASQRGTAARLAAPVGKTTCDFQGGVLFDDAGPGQFDYVTLVGPDGEDLGRYPVTRAAGGWYYFDFRSVTLRPEGTYTLLYHVRGAPH